jgi:hypothetical protein
MGNAPAEDIVDRLRGKYAVGPMLDGKPEFGYRTFAPLPPIFGEAAAEIEALRTALARVEGEKNDWMQRAAKGAESFNAALADCRILATELDSMQRRIEEWNEAVECVIGRQPRTGIHPNDRADQLIAKYATKGGGA